jgi:hypothetical protein
MKSKKNLDVGGTRMSRQSRRHDNSPALAFNVRLPFHDTFLVPTRQRGNRVSTRQRRVAVTLARLHSKNIISAIILRSRIVR